MNEHKRGLMGRVYGDRELHQWMMEESCQKNGFVVDKPSGDEGWQHWYWKRQFVLGH